MGPSLFLGRILSTILATEQIATDRTDEAVAACALAERDLLTDLPNRRGWEAALASEQTRSLRYGSIASIIALDLDGLKLINDEAGHAAGDTALLACAAVLRHECRAGDAWRDGRRQFGRCGYVPRQAPPSAPPGVCPRVARPSCLSSRAGKETTSSPAHRSELDHSATTWARLDPPTGDLLAGQTHDEVTVPARPGFQRAVQCLVDVGRFGQLAQSPTDEHAPTAAGPVHDVVDFEGSWRVETRGGKQYRPLGSSQQDVPTVEKEVDRRDRQLPVMNVCQAPHRHRRDQLQCFLLAKPHQFGGWQAPARCVH